MSLGSAQAAAGVGKEQIDAAGVGDEVVVHGARVFCSVSRTALEVGEEAVDGAAEVRRRP